MCIVVTDSADIAKNRALFSKSKSKRNSTCFQGNNLICLKKIFVSKSMFWSIFRTLVLIADEVAEVAIFREIGVHIDK